MTSLLVKSLLVRHSSQLEWILTSSSNYNIIGSYCLLSTSSKSKKKNHKGNNQQRNVKKQSIQHQKPKKRKEHNRQIKKIEPNKKDVPPLFLYATGSPSVYISSIAIDNSSSSFNYDEETTNNEIVYNNHTEQEINDDDDFNHEQDSSKTIIEQSTPINPTTLFTETNPPLSFTHSSFEYISPKVFNHELPTDTSIPEIAFLGRSNVGKSSLLNAITGVRDLARISKTPGRTQQVNYFGQFRKSSKNHNLDDNEKERNLVSNPPTGYIIDLPGYGYAKAPDDRVNEWQKNTQDFIVARKELGTLQRIYMLIDARRSIHIIDSSIMGWLDEAGVDYTVVLTKCDSVTKPILVKGANEICMRYHSQCHQIEACGEIVGYQSPFVHITSSSKGIGIVDLMYAVEADFYVGHE